jgi:hypothetical protein
MQGFEWADAWILAASIRAAMNHRTPELQDLLAWSDAINKAIPTPAELSGAFTLLVAAGFAQQVGNTIRPTKKGLWLNRRVNWWRRSAFEETQRLARSLQQLPAPALADRIVVTDDEFENAYRKYHAFATEIIERLLKDDGRS